MMRKKNRRYFLKTQLNWKRGGKSPQYLNKNKLDRINNRLDFVIKYKETRRHSDWNYSKWSTEENKEKNMNSFSDLYDPITQSNSYIIWGLQGRGKEKNIERINSKIEFHIRWKPYETIWII